MASYLKKRGDVYYSNIRIPGTDKFLVRSLETTDEREATTLVADLLRSVRESSPKQQEKLETTGRMGEISLQTLLANAEKHYRDSGKAEGTIRIVRRAMLNIMAAMPELTKIREITPETLIEVQERWKKAGRVKVDERGRVVTTRNTGGCNRELRQIITIMRYAEDEYGLPPQNWRKVKKRFWRENKHRKIVYSQEEHALLEAVASQSDQMMALYMLAYQCGLRRAEIRHLWKTDIDFRAGLVHVRAKDWNDPITGQPCHWAPKCEDNDNDMSRSVPMSSALVAFLKGRLERIPGQWLMSDNLGVPPHVDTMTDRWGEIVRKTVKRGSIHSLRHSYVTDLLANGEDIRRVQQFAGHKNLTTTEGYDHFVAKESVASDKLHAPTVH